MDIVIDPPLNDDLRDAVADLWRAASNAGGAIGFVGQVDVATTKAATDDAFAGVASGHDRLAVGYHDGRLVGAFFLCDQRFGLTDHHRTVKRLMVDPDAQGRGYGRDLLAAAEEMARADGVVGIRLVVRDGLGLDRFYARCGYREVGRYPGGLRVAPGDDRDEIHFFREVDRAD